MTLNVYKSMGPDDIHPRVLGEMADVLAELLSIIFENSWLSGEVPGDWKRETFLPLLRTGERKTRELQAGEPHLCAWEDHGADPPRSYVKAHMR